MVLTTIFDPKLLEGGLRMRNKAKGEIIADGLPIDLHRKQSPRQARQSRTSVYHLDPVGVINHCPG